MAIAAITNFFNLMGTGARLGPCDHWDGYSEVVTPISISGGIFQGYSLNWGGFDMQSTNSPFFNQPYAGYNTNWGGFSLPALENTMVNSPYAGYTTNWGQYGHPIEESLYDVDLDSVIDHPKDQIIYYKLKGWNPNTSTYESWVVSHNITARPALDGGLFDPDPGRSPPNVERDVFKTPPSGNPLVNIVIVARWLE